jgi:hypothetical protein
VPVREGLARLEGVESISERPNLKNATCEVRLKNGRLMDPLTLSNHIFNIRVGARLRGLEAVIDGTLERQENHLLLRVSGSNTALSLAPLSRKVQLDTRKKSPEPPARSESKAYKSLLTNSKASSRRVQIIGPLVKKEDGRLVLEVRRFEFSP